ncbi:hypothetical protein [Streptomyces beihaiensis]|uniref:Gram-positive cocci surface proteins LPxTG domain-containing protein n=1 Tax=Streptomyces beihaiensis TaxID=2984495 RepID=A0ABT3U5C0_9ACTN|nr:hypothetical protein [Streptomyces beihaiensis]MCX3063856.1 hypothetical protein [Streptomyces beihaiensis]
MRGNGRGAKGLAVGLLSVLARPVLALSAPVLSGLVMSALVVAALVLALFTVAPAAVAYAADPSPHGSLAGTRAGVGRTPPGRPLPPPPRPELTLPPMPPAPTGAVTPAPTSTPTFRRPAAQQQADLAHSTEPGMDLLPLGAGLLMTGLGLGFLALRLRRG